MLKLIIDVDDFGLFKVINYGIIESYKIGIIIFILFMLNLEIVEYVIVFVKDYLDLFIG